MILVLLAACGGGDQAGEGPSAGAKPIAKAVDAETFRARLQPRLPNCVNRMQTRAGLSEADAQSFCACQLDLTAAKATPEERSALLKMTFQSETDKPNAEEAQLATDALLRLQPEIKQTCGG